MPAQVLFSGLDLAELAGVIDSGEVSDEAFRCIRRGQRVVREMHDAFKGGVGAWLHGKRSG